MAFIMRRVENRPGGEVNEAKRNRLRAENVAALTASLTKRQATCGTAVRDISYHAKAVLVQVVRHDARRTREPAFSLCSPTTAHHLYLQARRTTDNLSPGRAGQLDIADAGRHPRMNIVGAVSCRRQRTRRALPSAGVCARV